MSNYEINKLVSDLNCAEREYDLLQDQHERKKQILLEEARRPITKERAAQVLIELGNLNHQREAEISMMSRKIEDLRGALRKMFDEKKYQ
jgi:hypothetical protein